MSDSCVRCGGRGELDQFKHIDSGRCYECQGTGKARRSARRARPLPPEERTPKKAHPSPESSKRRADDALQRVAQRFAYIASAEFRQSVAQGYDSYEDAYYQVGRGLGEAVFDHERFLRAVERARARIPAQYLANFREGVENSVYDLQQAFENIQTVRLSGLSGAGVAATILEQMGGIGSLSAMVGASQFIDMNGGVKFRFKGSRTANLVIVRLSPSDTYTVEFYRMRGMEHTLVGVVPGVHAPQLRPVFEQFTGLYLSMGAMR